MYEANNSTFKPVDGDLPNTMLRFNLEGVKSKATVFSDGGEFNMLGAVILFVLFVGGVYVYTEKESEHKEEKKLSKTGEKINQAKSQLWLSGDEGRVEQSEASRDRVRKESELNIQTDYEDKLRQERSQKNSRLKRLKQLSPEEVRMKKLTPDLSAINPDEEQ